MQLIFATRNAHKIREVRELAGNEFRVVDLSGLPDVELPKETGTTFEQNAALKALHVSRSTKDLVIADDSGLEVGALNGAPGIYSARYAGKNAKDAANLDKLLRELSGVTQRSARFRCVIALARQGKLLATVEGVVEGSITNKPSGEGGFGYDPIFQPNGFGETFAEMTPALKNKISHRAKAIAALREKLREIGA